MTQTDDAAAGAPTLLCRHCGSPLRPRRIRAGAAYCGSGCALADRLPTPDDNGDYRATAPVIVAVAVGFAFFNEALFWSLSVVGRADTLATFARLSIVAGGLVWMALAVGLAGAAVRGWGDLVAALATLALAGWAALRPEAAPGGVLGANAVLALWVARGWGKKKFRRKPALRV